LKPEVVGSILGGSNFLKSFCFTVEKKNVIITKFPTKTSYDVIRNSEPSSGAEPEIYRNTGIPTILKHQTFRSSDIPITRSEEARRHMRR
jgi:hypothetical protein